MSGQDARKHFFEFSLIFFQGLESERGVAEKRNSVNRDEGEEAGKDPRVVSGVGGRAARGENIHDYNSKSLVAKSL